ncbi:MAG: hypothetical protein KZQ83_03300 [gamma proteobacterium symbiont of Taylorina sp.]|nr:hypothetical protein [gamma proteobacterium symbiont of Taylorina sp.]
MNDKSDTLIKGKSLKEGPVIYHPEDYLIDEHKIKKNLSLTKLNNIFKLYLQKSDLRYDDISILGQFSIIFNDPAFSLWHTMSLSEQSKALSELVVMPQLYDELITSIGGTAGDAMIIKSVVKDAYQNAVDSFSHAAFLQKKYLNQFPAIKIILYIDQFRKLVVLSVVDNGYGKNFLKPKKSFVDQKDGNDLISRFVDWFVRRYIEKSDADVKHDIAYTGGQGQALKKIKIEMQLDVDVHFLDSGAVFEIKLRNYF